MESPISLLQAVPKLQQLLGACLEAILPDDNQANNQDSKTAEAEKAINKFVAAANVLADDLAAIKEDHVQSPAQQLQQKIAALQEEERMVTDILKQQLSVLQQWTSEIDTLHKSNVNLLYADIVTADDAMQI